MHDISRRGFLARGAGLIGCSAAAHPLMTTVTLASAPSDARLVVLILRGAMDGMDVVRPVGDPDYAGLRPMIERRTEPGLPLDGFFALHPALAGLMPLWEAGELAFAHAVSTPYRDKRSHFDGQDMLEAGTGMDVEARRVQDGWLNRMIQTVPGMTGETAYAIGRDDLKVLDGRADVSRWSAQAALDVTPQSRLLLGHLYHDDPLFRDTAEEALALAELTDLDAGDDRSAFLETQIGRRGGNAVEALAAFAAERLYADTRIAAFSVPGWDTHRDQFATLPRSLGTLEEVVLTLKKGLGPVWEKTTILAMTEFGRTVRENGSSGTDHGTGGAMLMAGGAIRGKRVLGAWPGLSEAALYERRDLMPTRDVRAYAAWAMRQLYGITTSRLTADIFPGLELGDDPRLIL